METGLEAVVPSLEETWRDKRAVVAANDVLLGFASGKSCGTLAELPNSTAWASPCTRKVGPWPRRPPVLLIVLPVTGLSKAPCSTTSPSVRLGKESASKPGEEVWLLACCSGCIVDGLTGVVTVGSASASGHSVGVGWAGTEDEDVALTDEGASKWPIRGQ